MSDTKMIALEVDPELRDRFVARAEAERRTPVQVLEDLMRDDLARGPGERNQSDLRRQALRYATASVALEGFEPPAESNRRAALHAEGKITFAQMIDLDAPDSMTEPQASSQSTKPLTVQERMLETAKKLGNDPSYRDKLKHLLF